MAKTIRKNSAIQTFSQIQHHKVQNNIKKQTKGVMMADLKKVFAPKEKSMGVTMVPVMLGSMIIKFTI